MFLTTSPQSEHCYQLPIAILAQCDRAFHEIDDTLIEYQVIVINTVINSVLL